MQGPEGDERRSGNSNAGAVPSFSWKGDILVGAAISALDTGSAPCSRAPMQVSGQCLKPRD